MVHGRIKEISFLVIAENGNQIPVGFMGIAKQHLEMLFISPEERGKGLGQGSPYPLLYMRIRNCCHQGMNQKEQVQ